MLRRKEKNVAVVESYPAQAGGSAGRVSDRDKNIHPWEVSQAYALGLDLHASSSVHWGHSGGLLSLIRDYMVYSFQYQ